MRREEKEFRRVSRAIDSVDRSINLVSGFDDEAVKRLQAERARLEARLNDLTVPCSGEAHSNPFIDNCMVCLPYTWGRVLKTRRVHVTKLPSGVKEVLVVHPNRNRSLWLTRDTVSHLVSIEFNTGDAIFFGEDGNVSLVETSDGKVHR